VEFAYLSVHVLRWSLAEERDIKNAEVVDCAISTKMIARLSLWCLALVKPAWPAAGILLTIVFRSGFP
jgi:hypothetical protein